MKPMRISVITSLYRCHHHLHRYFDAVSRLTNPDEVELLLIHNEPTHEEVSVIRDAMSRIPRLHIHHILVPHRESLYASWNRGMQLAQAEYIAIWNVDDIREPDSLQRQAATLDKHPEVAMTYGDIVGIQQPHERTGVYYHHPEFGSHPREFLRSFYSSCFPMWRKAVHEVVGYFDEQFRIVGDFDFQVRVARQFPLAKTQGLLGYYLEGDPKKLSSSYSDLERERTVIELRYGQFDKVNLVFLPAALLKHRILYILCGAERIAVPSVFPRYWSFVLSRIHLFVGSLVQLPWNVVRYIKNRVLSQSQRCTAATSPANEILEKKLRWLQNSTGVGIRGVLHVGAHIGQEASVYHKLGLQPVLWVEGNNEVYERLLQNIANFPGQQAFCCLASDVDGIQVCFHITDNDGESSSVLEINENTMRSEYPNLKVIRVVEGVTSRLDTFFEREGVNTKLCNFLNLDVQGYELAVIRGLGARLDSIDFICCEVNFGRVYKEAPLFHELDWFITGRNFKRVWLTATGVQGEALYVRSGMTLVKRICSYATCFAVEAGYLIGFNALVRRNGFLFSMIKNLYSYLKRMPV